MVFNIIGSLLAIVDAELGDLEAVDLTVDLLLADGLLHRLLFEVHHALVEVLGWQVPLSVVRRHQLGLRNLLLGAAFSLDLIHTFWGRRIGLLRGRLLCLILWEHSHGFVKLYASIGLGRMGVKGGLRVLQVAPLSIFRCLGAVNFIVLDCGLLNLRYEFILNAVQIFPPL